MSNMKSLDARGAINILFIPVIVLTLFLFGTGGFAIWAYMGRQDFKNNVDQKVAVAVAAGKQDQQKVDAAAYAEDAKKPFDTYIGPSAFGNITVKYPKTWSAFVTEADTSSTPLDGYFQPSVVPSISDASSSFALRLQLVQNSYDSVMAQYNGLVQSKQVTVAPYTLAKVPSVVGSRIEGQIKPTKQGTMIVLPLRNLTLEIWTESNNFKADLDNNILPNLSFTP